MSYTDPELRCLQHTPTGAEYVSQITSREDDRITRSAFRELTLRLAPKGARLFDFGAGPGIDARFFAERGFPVEAYDVDPRMCDFFSGHCRELMDSGQVVLYRSTYRNFINNAAERQADMVVSNFAPLNLVEDLRELFGKFAALTAPEGRVLASVLNPCYLPDMRSRYWWRGALKLWRQAELFLPGPQAPYFRRLLRHYASACQPYFRLRSLYPCMPDEALHEEGIDMQGPERFAWLRTAHCRYVFLLFDKVRPA
jgi:SAM-dependent methyltransferase